MHIHSSHAQTRAPMEHRWGQRITINVPVRIESVDGETANGRLLDASISGALLETDLHAPVCTPLTVWVPASEGSRAQVLDACVTRTEPGRLGIEWRDMASKPLLQLLRDVGGQGLRLNAPDVAFG
jgi:hypothetical protein